MINRAPGPRFTVVFLERMSDGCQLSKINVYACVNTSPQNKRDSLLAY